jgi:hypothetical protein
VTRGGLYGRDVNDDAFCEWLLSDHPDAKAERDRRDADCRPGQRNQARTRGRVPAPPVRPARLVRLQFPRGHVPATPDAACTSHDPELWFSPFPQAIAQAQAICGGCPHQAPCRSGALERRETSGIWGGTDVNPRHREDVA